MCKLNKRISSQNIKDYADLFSLRKKYFWDSNAEKIAYDVFKEELDEHYIVLPHVAFTNVFDINAPKNIEYKLRACVSEYHFDFVIYNSEYLLPVLLIEINGGAHAKSSKRDIDTFKEKLLTNTKGKETELNLINIDVLDHLPDDELLKDRIRKTLHYTIGSRLRYRAYCPNPECRTPLKYLQNRNTKKHFYLCPHCKNKDNQAKNETFDEIEIPYLFKTNEL